VRCLYPLISGRKGKRKSPTVPVKEEDVEGKGRVPFFLRKEKRKNRGRCSGGRREGRRLFMSSREASGERAEGERGIVLPGKGERGTAAVILNTEEGKGRNNL